MKVQKKDYGDPVPDSVKERIDFELQTIKGMGFPGYFLYCTGFHTGSKGHGGLLWARVVAPQQVVPLHIARGSPI